LVVYSGNKKHLNNIGIIIQEPICTPNGNTVRVAWEEIIKSAYVWSLEKVNNCNDKKYLNISDNNKSSN
jgi:hypothetical protein